MAEGRNIKFVKYFGPLLNALHEADPQPLRPRMVVDWVREHAPGIPPEDLIRTVKNVKQTIFENGVHWARFYLVKGGLVSDATRGFWSLTFAGRNTQLTDQDAWELFDRVQAMRGETQVPPPEGAPVPDTMEVDEENVKSYWFVGAIWNRDEDQLPRFLEEGIWQNGYQDQLLDLVREIRPGDLIAVKATCTKKRGLPFNVGGKPVSVMRIKATGTVLENVGDGRTVRVDWDAPVESRDWYFYTYRTTIVKADTESPSCSRLINFTFRGVPQDYAWFLNVPYWREKYQVDQVDISVDTPPDPVLTEDEETPEEIPQYTVQHIVDEGCFLSSTELTDILDRWEKKKNLILQGPPGTGKTWLAKRLGFALVGSNNREAIQSRLRVVQFHPTMSYEDFVRGWRPSGDGKLQLIDGILMEAIHAAESEPDRPFVLVIEEINRGNPAQILGEMLTLLEATKRHRSEAMELAYRRTHRERIYIPANLYVIGTMNIADRSLALVDTALRRRFAFIDLEPRFDAAWHAWCAHSGLERALLETIASRISALNADIAAAITLGKQFRIGHSYVTPDANESIPDGRAWFKAKVCTEIGPQLDEYWYDAPETAQMHRDRLLAGFD
jgi:5-methylcytosine-specific restriction protein B